MSQVFSLTGGSCLRQGSMRLGCRCEDWRCELGGGELEALPEAMHRSVALWAEHGELVAVRHFPVSRLVHAVVFAAFIDAGKSASDIRGTRTGFVSGSYFGCADFLDTLREDLVRLGPRSIKPTEFSIATQGYPAASLGISLAATGPATAFIGGGAVEQAVGFSQFMLETDMADRMVVIGFDLLGPATRAFSQRDRRSARRESVTAVVLEPGTGILPLAELTAALDAKTGAAGECALAQSFDILSWTTARRSPACLSEEVAA